MDLSPCLHAVPTSQARLLLARVKPQSFKPRADSNRSALTSLCDANTREVLVAKLGLIPCRPHYGRPLIFGCAAAAIGN